jgi:hypothetical protein
LATAARAGLGALALGLRRLALMTAGGARSAARGVRRVATASSVALTAILALAWHVMSKGFQALRARLPFLITLIARTAGKAKSALLAGLAVVATRSSIGVGQGLSLGRETLSGSSAAMAGFSGTVRPLAAAFLSRSVTAGRGVRDLAQRSIGARMKGGKLGGDAGIRASLDRMAAFAARAGHRLRAIIANIAPPERTDDLRIAGVAGAVAVFLLLVTAWSHMSTSSVPSVIMAFPEKPSLSDLKASDAGSVIRSPKIAFASPRSEASEPPLSPEDALNKLIEDAPQAEKPTPATRWIGPLPIVQ